MGGGTLNEGSDRAKVNSLRDETIVPGPGPLDPPSGVERPTRVFSNSSDVISGSFPKAPKLMRTPPNTQRIDSFFQGAANKRRADASTAEDLPGSSTKKTKIEREALLLEEIDKLNNLIKLHPRKSKEIKESAEKLIPLARLAFIESSRAESIPLPEIKPPVESTDAQCQTCTADEIKAANLRMDFETRPLEELLPLTWPGCAFEATSISKGGMGKAREGAVRVIIAQSDKLDTDHHIQRLAMEFPLVKSLNEKSLPAGKVATLRCKEAMTIDGEECKEDGQIIVVCALKSSDDRDLKDATDRLVGQARHLKARRLQIGIPDTIDTSKARKILEISLIGSGIAAEICASKSQRQAHAQATGKSKGPRRQLSSTIVLRPNEGVSFADVVKELKSEVDPEAMGVHIRALNETKTAVKVVYSEKTNGAGAGFFQKVKSIVQTTASCDRKTEEVIIEGIESGCDEKAVQLALSECLTVDKEALTVGDIFRNRRGNRMTFVNMESSIARRAAEIRLIRIGWSTSRMRLKIEPDFCGKCKSYGHKANSCKNEPVDIRCRKCGKTDHKSAECDNEDFCHTCNVAGHRSNNTGCPTFRRMVEIKRKQC